MQLLMEVGWQVGTRRALWKLSELRRFDRVSLVWSPVKVNHQYSIFNTHSIVRPSLLIEYSIVSLQV